MKPTKPLNQEGYSMWLGGLKIDGLIELRSVLERNLNAAQEYANTHDEFMKTLVSGSELRLVDPKLAFEAADTYEEFCIMLKYFSVHETISRLHADIEEIEHRIDCKKTKEKYRELFPYSVPMSPTGPYSKPFVTLNDDLKGWEIEKCTLATDCDNVPLDGETFFSLVAAKGEHKVIFDNERLDATSMDSYILFRDEIVKEFGEYEE